MSAMLQNHGLGATNSSGYQAASKQLNFFRRGNTSN
jgi:hypothetical protein